MRTTTAVVLTFLVLCLAALPVAAQQRIHWFPFDKTPGEGGEGWTLTGEWQYGAPEGLGGIVCTQDPEEACHSYDPSSAHTGSYVYGYDNAGDGHYEDGSPQHPLTTKALDCTRFVNVTLRFWRWLGVGDPVVDDHASIEVSNNGTDWTLVWENSDDIADPAWRQVEYDISAVADGQPTVYVRWVMGPTGPAGTFCGWNIDDVEILGEAVTDILAWIPYTDTGSGAEYDNTLAALDTYYMWYGLATSTTEDAGVLAAELAGKDVFLAMEQGSATSAQLATLGAAFSDALTDFVEQGGTVVVLGERDGVHEGFLDATGLMSCDAVGRYSLGEALPVVSPPHPLAFGLGSTVAAQDATNSYTVGPEAEVVIEDPSGNAVVAARLLGLGAAIVIGYDYFEYDTDAARVLANAVQYPQATDDILLYQDSNVQFLAQQALDHLALSYTTAGQSDFNTRLTGKSWSLVAVDAPSRKPAGGFAELCNFFATGGRGTVSTYSLTADEPALTAAFGVSADETFTTPQPIYRWDPLHPVLAYPMDVPDLVIFNDIYPSDADRLSYVSGYVLELAGIVSSSTSGQAAIVIADGIRILNSFLWDESNQDSDTDGMDDCLELIINEIEFLRPGPRADFWAGPTQCVPGQGLTFTDDSAVAPVAWYWDFGDGDSSAEQNPSHDYADPGIYDVSLTVADAYGRDVETKARYIWVAFLDCGPDNWAFQETLLCADADIVQGYAGGYYQPNLPVSRAQMATYISRALAGGDSAVPDPTPPATFDDVPDDYWAWKYVEYAVSQNVVQGYSPTIYAPEVEVDRGQMAVFIARARGWISLGDPMDTAPELFADVPAGFWSGTAIEACVDNSVVQGYEAGLYHPEIVVTRDQMAVYVARAFGLLP